MKRCVTPMLAAALLALAGADELAVRVEIGPREEGGR